MQKEQHYSRLQMYNELMERNLAQMQCQALYLLTQEFPALRKLASRVKYIEIRPNELSISGVAKYKKKSLKKLLLLIHKLGSYIMPYLPEEVTIQIYMDRVTLQFESESDKLIFIRSERLYKQLVVADFELEFRVV